MIRIFNTDSGEKLQELRRGSESASIKHLTFEWDTGSYLSCTSDKNTIHIFKCPPVKEITTMQESAGVATTEEQKGGNTKSYFSALSSMVSIAGSEWSFAQFRLDP